MKTVVVDMDGVICEERPTFERSMAPAVPGARRRLDELRSSGYRIIIHTARSWSELAMTEEWLRDRGIAYDQLVMGKPVADIIVDDRAVTSLEEAAGVVDCDTSVKPVTETQKQLYEPVAFAVVRPDREITAIAFRSNDARDRATGSDRVVPLYLQPQPVLTGEERAFLELHAQRLVGWSRSSDDSKKELVTVRGLLERLG